MIFSKRSSLVFLTIRIQDGNDLSCLLTDFSSAGTGFCIVLFVLSLPKHLAMTNHITVQFMEATNRAVITHVIPQY